jgi:adenosylcobinamide-phosphate synthase
MGAVERATYRPNRVAGVGYAAAGVALGWLGGSTVRSTAAASYVSIAGRSLCDAARAVGAALDAGDLEEARRRLPSLVGRDPAGLDEGELARAVVESVAENTVDAVVAPALWAVAFGARGTLAYRAINTMDAMVGYRSERYAHFGTAAARLDDVANWVPARVTGALVAVARPRSAAEVARVVRRDAGGHPSPNSGVAEAAFAAALGIQLGGLNRYGDRIEDRPRLGDGRPAEPIDIERACDLSRDCTLVLAGVLSAGAVARGVRRRAREAA